MATFSSNAIGEEMLFLLILLLWVLFHLSGYCYLGEQGIVLRLIPYIESVSEGRKNFYIHSDVRATPQLQFSMKLHGTHLQTIRPHTVLLCQPCTISA